MGQGVYREALAQSVRAKRGHDAVLELDSGPAYEEAFNSQPPPAVAMVHLGPDAEEGLRTIAWINRNHKATMPLACGHQAGEEVQKRAMEAGSRGYLCTRSSLAAYHHALEELLATGRYACAALQAHDTSLGAYLRQRQQLLALLSARELDVLLLICHPAALTYKDVGLRLAIGSRTVETHIASLCRKLGVRGRPGLMLCAVHWRLLEAGALQPAPATTGSA